MPQFSDIPEGFEVASANRAPFSDLPPGFAVAQPKADPMASVRAQMDKMRNADFAPQAKRQAQLGVRMVTEGLGDVVTPWADAAAALINPAIRKTGFQFPTNHGQQLSGALTNAGMAEPQTTAEKAGNLVGRVTTGAAASAGPMNAVMARLGFAKPSPNAPTAPKQAPPPQASTPAARTLERAGVRLDASQRDGGRFTQMLRSAVTDHPATATTQEKFTEAQAQDFTRAVLRSVGEDAPEATHGVMLRAKQRIQSLFNSVGKDGIAVDDQLLNDLGKFEQVAQRTVLDSNQSVLFRNFEDVVGAMQDGKIPGKNLVEIRSNLSALSKQPGVGDAAGELEDILLDALQRSYPDQKQVLQTAVDQWRNLKIIEPAISKDADRYISPKLLANSVSSVRNRAMSIYGQGGDQELVELARAGKSVLPEVLGNSGTTPRAIMQSPVKAAATTPLYVGAQDYLLRQPGNALAAGQGVLRRNYAAPAAGAAVTNALASKRRNSR